MRERTPFDRALFDRLPDLRLLVTTGMVNAADRPGRGRATAACWSAAPAAGSPGRPS